MPLVSPLVSTIVPVFNRAAMLREAVASVVAQTHRPIEVVIVDDGSTDDTLSAAHALADVHREVRVITQENAGPGAAREAGRRIARGDFVQYLDSDDLLEPRKFELQVAALIANPACGAAYGRTRLLTKEGQFVEPWKGTARRVETMFPSFLQSRWWDTSTPLYRRFVIDAAGPWSSLRIEEDWEYDARVAALGTTLCFVDEEVSITRERAVDVAGPAIMRDRARAHALIYEHARRFGIGHDAPEMQHFARELFLLARQAGAAGLRDESRMLFDLAREASGPGRDRLQFRAYAAFARLAGWPLAGKIACFSDRLRW
jgi:glycosyltransferase involved in cell wall biosynthesis